MLINKTTRGGRLQINGTSVQKIVGSAVQEGQWVEEYRALAGSEVIKTDTNTEGLLPIREGWFGQGTVDITGVCAEYGTRSFYVGEIYQPTYSSSYVNKFQADGVVEDFGSGVLRSVYANDYGSRIYGPVVILVLVTSFSNSKYAEVYAVDYHGTSSGSQVKSKAKVYLGTGVVKITSCCVATSLYNIDQSPTSLSGMFVYSVDGIAYGVKYSVDNDGLNLSVGAKTQLDSGIYSKVDVVSAANNEDSGVAVSFYNQGSSPNLKFVNVQGSTPVVKSSLDLSSLTEFSSCDQVYCASTGGSTYTEVAWINLIGCKSNEIVCAQIGCRDTGVLAQSYQADTSVVPARSGSWDFGWGTDEIFVLSRGNNVRCYETVRLSGQLNKMIIGLRAEYTLAQSSDKRQIRTANNPDGFVVYSNDSQVRSAYVEQDSYEMRVRPLSSGSPIGIALQSKSSGTVQIVQPS